MRPFSSHYSILYRSSLPVGDKRHSVTEHHSRLAGHRVKRVCREQARLSLWFWKPCWSYVVGNVDNGLYKPNRDATFSFVFLFQFHYDFDYFVGEQLELASVTRHLDKLAFIIIHFMYLKLASRRHFIGPGVSRMWHELSLLIEDRNVVSWYVSYVEALCLNLCKIVYVLLSYVTTKARSQSTGLYTGCWISLLLS